jgi:CHAT domain
VSKLADSTILVGIRCAAGTSLNHQWEYFMIHRRHPDEPVFFSKSKIVADRQKEIDTWRQNPDKPPLQRIPWGDKGIPDFIPALAALFHYKCVYCERVIGLTDSGGDFFRPPRNARQFEESFATNNHYRWLSWTWRNIYFACNECIGHKGLCFPTQERRRAPLHTPINGIHNSEFALILDPCNSSINPLRELDFDRNGHVQVRDSMQSERARIIIKLLKLNERPDLIAGRKRACDEIERLYRQVTTKRQLDTLNTADRDIQSLETACGELEPYAGARRQHLYRLLKDERRQQGRWKGLYQQLKKWIDDPVPIPLPPPPLPQSLETIDECEISLKGANGVYQVHVRYTVHGNAVSDDFSLGRSRIKIDPLALLPLRLDEGAYGERLRGMFFKNQKLKELFIRAQAQASGANVPLRIRLCLDANDAPLNAIRWELLKDPDTNRFLFQNSRVLFSRYPLRTRSARISTLASDKLRVGLFIAAPSDLTSYNLRPINRHAELDAAMIVLRNYSVSITPNGTLAALVTALRSGATDIVYIVCHGHIPRQGSPVLYLERDNAKVESVPVDKVVESMINASLAPRLIILASCQSAGKGDDPDNALVAVGPQLAAAGAGAVLAMHDTIAMATVAAGMPVFFDELQQHRRIDRAVAVMRSDLSAKGKAWWQPVLFHRLRDGW